MFKIALVQNASEMRNYSYADNRPLIRKMGFDFVNITYENISDLDKAIQSNVNCVLFSSNALNDTVIYNHVCGEEFCSLFKEYLYQGGSTLILHQIGLAKKPGDDEFDPFPFIHSEQIKRLTKVDSGKTLSIKCSEGRNEAYLLFPNKVNSQKIVEQSHSNPNIDALYWTKLEFKDTTEWMPIVRDGDNNFLISKMSTKQVVISSIVLDWQNHFELLENILVNLMTNRTSVALINSGLTNNVGLNFFLDSLSNKKLYYKIYNNDEQGIEDLERCIKVGVHSSVMFIGDEKGTNIPDRIKSMVDSYGVKIVEVVDNDVTKSDTYVVHTVDKEISIYFAKVEFKLQGALELGYVSGSFSSSIDILKRLKYFADKELARGTYNEEFLGKVLKLTKEKVDCSKSFDRTIGATCKALWLFNTFVPKEDYDKICYRWLKEQNISRLGIREKLEVHLALSLLEKNSEKFLRSNCYELISECAQNGFKSLSEYDVLELTEVAVKLKDTSLLNPFVDYVAKNLVNGKFYSTYVTASMMSHLIDIYELLEGKPEEEANIHLLQEMLFDMNLYLSKEIKTDFVKIEEEVAVASALYKFEHFISFPVNDLTDLLFRTGEFPKRSHFYESSISNFEKVRIQKDCLNEQVEKLQVEVASERKKMKFYKFYSISFMFFVVAFVALVWFSVNELIILKNNGLLESLTFWGFLEKYWPMFLTMVVIPLLKVASKKIEKMVDKK